jgi:putative endonuclease
MQGGWVYILTNRPNGTLYTGVTSDLLRRLEQHRMSASGFTNRYNLDKLVHVERHNSIISAIQREKNIKHWSRAWKIALIEAENSGWADLTPSLTVTD